MKTEKEERKQNQNKQPEGTGGELQQTVNDDNEDNKICMLCNLKDPASDNVNKQCMVPWIQCDGCLCWCDMECVGLEGCLPEVWMCLGCS